MHAIDSHSHDVTDPGHCHGIFDPGHCHSILPAPPRHKLTLSQALRATKDIDPADRIVKQPCGKSPPKGINFVPAVGAKYLAWTKGAYE